MKFLKRNKPKPNGAAHRRDESFVDEQAAEEGERTRKELRESSSGLRHALDDLMEQLEQDNRRSASPSR